MKPISFGLKKGAAPKKAAAAFSSNVGDESDDDSPTNNSTSSNALASSSGTSKRVAPAQLMHVPRHHKQQQQQQEQVDESVYQYDELYEHMKEGQRRAKESKKAQDTDRKPKYISNLLETAEQRKRDRLRAEDKMVAREREREGDSFADKDAFVTPAYLEQQDQLRQAEEEEKRKEERDAKRAAKEHGATGGLSSFYKQYLEQDSEAHAQAIKAAEAAAASSSASGAGAGQGAKTTQQDEQEKTEAQLAREFQARTGKQVQVNDDGQVVDKRELLTGGLNVASKKRTYGAASKPSGGFGVKISERTPVAEEDKYVGPNTKEAIERGKQSRARHSREVERQMLALEERRKREAEDQLQHEVHKVAKRNNEDKVAALKRKAEERRKAREAAAAAAAAAAPPGGDAPS